MWSNPNLALSRMLVLYSLYIYIYIYVYINLYIYIYIYINAKITCFYCLSLVNKGLVEKKDLLDRFEGKALKDILC